MATAKAETSVTSVTLTLTVAEAEAVYALTGCVSGGMTTGAVYDAGPERAASDNVYDALRDALGKVVTETTFYKSLNRTKRYIELAPAMPKWERDLLADSED